MSGLPDMQKNNNKTSLAFQAPTFIMPRFSNPDKSEFCLLYIDQLLISSVVLVQIMLRVGHFFIPFRT